MLVFTNCKINIGLNITEKRPDGFHTIETVLYPINWCDSLEVIEVEKKSDFKLNVSGFNAASVQNTDNILYKAYYLIKSKYKLPGIDVYLHKNLPMGAGLGGGSSNAAFFIKLLDEKFGLNMSSAEMLKIASDLGSDCAFFIKNKPVYATEKGDVFKDINVNISAYYILLVWPAIISNTKEAYSRVTPQLPKISTKDILLKEPIDTWKDLLKNDFEATIFEKYPDIKTVKELMYSANAVYASMSGSGSAVYGIFKEKPLINFPENYLCYLEEPLNSLY